MAKSSIAKFYSELKRRKVIRVALTYVVIAWIVVEIASVLFPNLLLPEWSVRLVVGLAIIGFPIALVLAWAVELTPDGVKAEATDTPVEGKSPAVEASPEKEGFDSIAVLPFLNLSNDPDNEYFSDGMSEELLNLLCKLPQLTVASRTSSFSFKGKDVDMVTVAEQLGVDVIVEGSVRRSGNRVRITCQLIDGRTDRHLWSENYDRELKDVFAVQDEIARNIVTALELSLSPDQQRTIKSAAKTDDMDAYDCYLRGRFFMERANLDQAIQVLEKAIKLDPGFALAWTAAADCHSWKCMWQKKTPEGVAAADEYSLKALQLAPELAESHASRAYALSMNEKYAEAEAEAKIAIELDSQLYEAYYYLGRIYFAQGKFRKAAATFNQAGVIRPDDLPAASLASTSTKSFGTEKEMNQAVQHSIEVAGRYLTLNPDDALALSRSANDWIYIGEVEKGLELAKRAYQINPLVSGYNVACAYMLAGETERAIDHLEKHARTGAVELSWVEQDSDWNAAKDHPRFKLLLKSLS